MPRTHPKRLLVEGNDDVYAIEGLMSHFVPWGQREADWPVYLEAAGSPEELLDPDVLSTYLKGTDVEALGLMVDANESFEGRWQRIHQVLVGPYPELPAELPREGLIHEEESGPRVGVWIMPDNRSTGMLETFLASLIPDPGQPLWVFAKEAAQKAKEHGAPYKETHRVKAEVRTWLAWQNPPGRPFGEALKAKALDPNLKPARPFVDWFVSLYQLEGSLLRD